MCKCVVCVHGICVLHTLHAYASLFGIAKFTHELYSIHGWDTKAFLEDLEYWNITSWILDLFWILERSLLPFAAMYPQTRHAVSEIFHCFDVLISCLNEC